MAETLVQQRSLGQRMACCSAATSSLLFQLICNFADTVQIMVLI
jgi:hypothetical protein